MTIPSAVRLPLLVAGPAALAALFGLAPGRSFSVGAPPDAWSRLSMEAWPLVPGLVLVALVAFSHAYEKRSRPLLDSIAGAAGLAGVFAASIARVEGIEVGLRHLASSLAHSPVSRSAVFCAAAAGCAIPLLAAVGELLPSGEARWGVRAASVPVALLLAVGWMTRPAPLLAKLAAGGASRLSWRGDAPVAIAVAALVVLLALRELLWSRILHRELSEEVTLGILPATHVAILASPWRRRLPRWWPERSERLVYVDTVLRLAYRKVQMRGLSPSSRRIGQVEVLRLRERIRGMLAPVEPPLEETLGGRDGERARRVIELSRS